MDAALLTPNLCYLAVLHCGIGLHVCTQFPVIIYVLCDMLCCVMISPLLQCSHQRRHQSQSSWFRKVTLNWCLSTPNTLCVIADCVILLVWVKENWRSKMPFIWIATKYVCLFAVAYLKAFLNLHKYKKTRDECHISYAVLWINKSCEIGPEHNSGAHIKDIKSPAQQQ